MSLTSWISGKTSLTIDNLGRNAWAMERVPYSAPINGNIMMRVAVAMEGGPRLQDFLTMFEDVGGFGAWNRRWCVLRTPFIKYWTYPDDVTKKGCVGTLDLRSCTTRKVEQVRFFLSICLFLPFRSSFLAFIYISSHHFILFWRRLLHIRFQSYFYRVEDDCLIS